jgi:hypothetical protein
MSITYRRGKRSWCYESTQLILKDTIKYTKNTHEKNRKVVCTSGSELDEYFTNCMVIIRPLNKLLC